MSVVLIVKRLPHINLLGEGGIYTPHIQFGLRLLLLYVSKNGSHGKIRTYTVQILSLLSPAVGLHDHNMKMN